MGTPNSRAGFLSDNRGFAVRRHDPLGLVAPLAKFRIRWLTLPCLLALAAIGYWGILPTFFVQDDFFMLEAAMKPAPISRCSAGPVSFGHCPPTGCHC